MTNCEVINNADMGSGYNGTMTPRMKISLSILKTINQNQKPININTQNIKDMKQIFKISFET